ncbi:D-alanyl-D-alanine carboxypeptidase/D-alanyl-D-alanine endopeptidase [Corynebacterium crudilactis]|uniref:D-alanyl-D-alanine carboxypeptidase/D-alanyl-D-alanine-endopeptidase n=1 Tax=Corynebacterium crudilactis TaxID=1652495 RepID=A0A172QVZ4_9CORY|nr:D-alanyl-D-alanine carboxypeptidase/D-alanyl-D-alanine-endopeptidase [Corynebacterium crudilactis]ANE04875.1 D-alanyl-D-alanine carboxypeptidase/D-alanyl-D-alanine-endopeptidase [Corynebacterium crudilactis]
MKNAWWVGSSVGVLIAVGAVIGGGVWVNQAGFGLNHPEPMSVEMPAPLFSPAINPDATETPDFSALVQQLDTQAADARLGTFVGVARDVESGEIVWEQNQGIAVRPASATKILTAAVALYELGRDDTIATEVVEGAQPGTVVIKAGGDVTLSQEKLDDLATQLEGQDINTVLIDTSIWPDESFASTWDPVDVDAGYIAKVEPAMIESARIGGAEGDLPRSHTPALDVAKAVADRIGATEVGEGTAAEGVVLASVESETLEKRLGRMMEDSDNVMAEGIAKEVAASKGLPTDSASTAQMTLDILKDKGLDLSGVSIVDNSGLSFDNLITPRLLDDILTRAATETELRSLLSSLPIAHGNGTLEERYEDLSGAGWVRAKTGTLTNTSALAGVVTSESGRVFTFAFVSNDAAIVPARAALDEMASLLRDF